MGAVDLAKSTLREDCRGVQEGVREGVRCVQELCGIQVLHGEQGAVQQGQEGQSCQARGQEDAEEGEDLQEDRPSFEEGLQVQVQGESQEGHQEEQVNVL